MFVFGDIQFKAVEDFDLQFLCEMRSDEDINDWLFTVFPISMSGQKKWLDNMLVDEKNKVFIAYSNNCEKIGCVRLSNIDHLNKKVEVGADICIRHRGSGYCKKIYVALEEYCFQYLGMHQMYLHVFAHNEKAIKCYESSGFELTATLNDWVFKKGYQDVCLYTKRYVAV
jgi:diamine N-acetyltransferase